MLKNFKEDMFRVAKAAGMIYCQGVRHLGEKLCGRINCNSNKAVSDELTMLKEKLESLEDKIEKFKSRK